jgi:heme-degrading monooxygenase HmoA
VVKVLLERTIKGKHVQEITRLLRRMRVLATQQPGYISGETLHAVDDPNHYLVISAWESLAHWQAWVGNAERQKIQSEIDMYMGESPTQIRVYTY